MGYGKAGKALDLVAKARKVNENAPRRPGPIQAPGALALAQHSLHSGEACHYPTPKIAALLSMAIG
ncbi:MAG: hypothetical protein NVS3B5_15530 [Sphingomicrobium sp.]